MIEVISDSGIDVATIRVLRQDRKNSRIISAVRQPAIAPSRTTPLMAARTKMLWSNRKSTLRLDGRPARILGISWRACCTTVKVEALPLLKIGSRAECRPSRRTRFVWGLDPSWTKATSPTYNRAPFT